MCISAFFHGDRCGCINISVGQAVSEVFRTKLTTSAISFGCIISSGFNRSGLTIEVLTNPGLIVQTFVPYSLTSSNKTN